MGDTKGGLNRESRERVKNTVNDLLASLGLTGMPNANKQQEPVAEDIIDVEVEDTEND
jgi:hypothetical protein